MTDLPNEDVPPPDDAYGDVRPLRRRTPTPVMFDRELEANLLGNILLDNRYDAAIEAGVNTLTFHDVAHQTWWQAIDNVGPDAAMCRIWLTERGLFDPAVFARLCDANNTIFNATHVAALRQWEHDRHVYNTLSGALNGQFGQARQIMGELCDTIDGWSVTTSTTNFFEDVMQALEGPLGEPPTIGMRDDGVCGLFYAGQLNNIIGESESGKSLLVQAVAVREVIAGNHVFYLDFEKGLPSVLERMMQMGASGNQLHELFHYQRREDPWTPTTLARLRAELAQHHPTFCVVDGVTNAMKLEGLDINDNSAIAGFYGGVPSILGSTGAAVTCVDHVTKSREGRAPGGIGGQHKRAGITGSSIEMRMSTPAGRDRTGTGRLIVDKDAPGHMRRHAVDGRIIADVTFVSTGKSLGVFITASTLKPKTADATGKPRLTGYMEKTSKTLEGFGDIGQSQRTITKCTVGEDGYVIAALATLVEEGYVSVAFKGNAKIHTSIKPYREAMDAAAFAAVEVPEDDADAWDNGEIF